MRKLIVIKHAKPQRMEELPPEKWPLSDEGREACKKLTEVLRPHDPAAIVSSEEPKARETGRIVAELLGKPSATAPDLQEHDRSNVPLLESREFISMMALFFKNRRGLVLGRETAEQAASRISRAIDSVLRGYPEGNIAIVTHGTVQALFAADCGAGDPFVLWRKMGLPSFMVFSLPQHELVEMVERVQT